MCIHLLLFFPHTKMGVRKLQTYNGNDPDLTLTGSRSQISRLSTVRPLLTSVKVNVPTI